MNNSTSPTPPPPQVVRRRAPRHLSEDVRYAIAREYLAAHSESGGNNNGDAMTARSIARKYGVSVGSVIKHAKRLRELVAQTPGATVSTALQNGRHTMGRNTTFAKRVAKYGGGSPDTYFRLVLCVKCIQLQLPGNTTQQLVLDMERFRLAFPTRVVSLELEGLLNRVGGTRDRMQRAVSTLRKVEISLSKEMTDRQRADLLAFFRNVCLPTFSTIRSRALADAGSDEDLVAHILAKGMTLKRSAGEFTDTAGSVQHATFREYYVKRLMPFLVAERCTFVDEAAVALNVNRNYAWALRGERAIVRRSENRGSLTKILAAIAPGEGSHVVLLPPLPRAAVRSMRPTRFDGDVAYWLRGHEGWGPFVSRVFELWTFFVSSMRAVPSPVTPQSVSSVLVQYDTLRASAEGIVADLRAALDGGQYMWDSVEGSLARAPLDAESILRWANYDARLAAILRRHNRVSGEITPRGLFGLALLGQSGGDLVPWDVAEAPSDRIVTGGDDQAAAAFDGSATDESETLTTEQSAALDAVRSIFGRLSLRDVARALIVLNPGAVPATHISDAELLAGGRASYYAREYAPFIARMRFVRVFTDTESVLYDSDIAAMLPTRGADRSDLLQAGPALRACVASCFSKLQLRNVPASLRRMPVGRVVMAVWVWVLSRVRPLANALSTMARGATEVGTDSADVEGVVGESGMPMLSDAFFAWLVGDAASALDENNTERQERAERRANQNQETTTVVVRRAGVAVAECRPHAPDEALCEVTFASHTAPSSVVTDALRQLCSSGNITFSPPSSSSSEGPQNYHVTREFHVMRRDDARALGAWWGVGGHFLAFAAGTSAESARRLAGVYRSRIRTSASDVMLQFARRSVSTPNTTSRAGVGENEDGVQQADAVVDDVAGADPFEVDKFVFREFIRALPAAMTRGRTLIMDRAPVHWVPTAPEISWNEALRNRAPTASLISDAELSALSCDLRLEAEGGDGVPWPSTADGANTIPRRMALVYTPPHTPQLNAIEFFFNVLKGAVRTISTGDSTPTLVAASRRRSDARLILSRTIAAAQARITNESILHFAKCAGYNSLVEQNDAALLRPSDIVLDKRARPVECVFPKNYTSNSNRPAMQFVPREVVASHENDAAHTRQMAMQGFDAFVALYGSMMQQQSSSIPLSDRSQIIRAMGATTAAVRGNHPPPALVALFRSMLSISNTTTTRQQPQRTLWMTRQQQPPPAPAQQPPPQQRGNPASLWMMRTPPSATPVPPPAQQLPLVPASAPLPIVLRPRRGGAGSGEWDVDPQAFVDAVPRAYVDIVGIVIRAQPMPPNGNNGPFPADGIVRFGRSPMDDEPFDLELLEDVRRGLRDGGFATGGAVDGFASLVLRNVENALYLPLTLTTGGLQTEAPLYEESFNMQNRVLIHDRLLRVKRRIFGRTRWPRGRSLVQSGVSTVFVPINYENSHWVLAVYDCQHDTWFVLDSMRITTPEFQGRVRQQVEQIHGHLVSLMATHAVRRPASETAAPRGGIVFATDDAPDDFPTQTDGYNCGMFVLLYIMAFARGKRLIGGPLTPVQSRRMGIGLRALVIAAMLQEDVVETFLRSL